MSLEANNPLTLEEVERDLTEIENKYSPIKTNGKEYFEGNLTVLSKVITIFTYAVF